MSNELTRGYLSLRHTTSQTRDKVYGTQPNIHLTLNGRGMMFTTTPFIELSFPLPFSFSRSFPHLSPSLPLSPFLSFYPSHQLCPLFPPSFSFSLSSPLFNFLSLSLTHPPSIDSFILLSPPYISTYPPNLLLSLPPFLPLSPSLTPHPLISV